MKLSELQPHWIGLAGWKAKEEFYVGVSFLCPHCVPKACPTCGHLPEHKRLAVNFWPPIDPSGCMGKMFAALPDNGGHRRVGGETFDTITLTPSIGFDGIGHWHGHLTAGVLTP